MISFSCYVGSVAQLLRKDVTNLSNLSNMSTRVSWKIGKVEKTKLWTTTESKKSDNLQRDYYHAHSRGAFRTQLII